MLSRPELGLADQRIRGLPAAGMDDAFAEDREERVRIELLDFRR
jgi:hypothetical protein